MTINKLHIYLIVCFLILNMDFSNLPAQNPRKHFRAAAFFLKKPELLVGAGRVYHELGNYEPALDRLDKALDLDKNNEQNMAILLALTELQRGAGKTEQALLNANLILNNDPENIQALILRSRLFADLKDFPNAIDDISSVILRQQSNIDIYKFLES